MREIKFRAWDKEKEIMHIQSKTCCFHIADNFVGVDYTDDSCYYNEWHGSLNMILMQFTGLKDQEGKEIYEGDIIEYEELQTDGSRHDCKQKIEIVSYDDHYNTFGLSVGTLWKVIGNIYQNSELLKEGKENEKTNNIG